MKKRHFHNPLKRCFLSLPELEIYHKELRRYRFEKGKKLKLIRLREALYPAFVLCVALDRIFRKETIELIGKRKRVKKQVIYACTHIGGDDCQRNFEAIGRGCWWFIGDPGGLYREAAGLLLHLNGCIMLDTGDKGDRRIAYQRAVELLKAGGSLMIYPEGARNGTENLPVMGLFQGTARMAMETGVDIIPIAIEQYDKRFVINMGDEIPVKEYSDKLELTQSLRDMLASLKWDIWEREGITLRSSLSSDYRELFIREFEERIFPYDTLESVERTRYRSEIPSPEEVFAHLESLEVKKENAFLWRR